MRCTSSGDAIQAMGGRDRKIKRENYGKKRKSTEFIYPPGSKIHEAQDHLTMRSFLQDDVITSDQGHYLSSVEYIFRATVSAWDNEHVLVFASDLFSFQRFKTCFKILFVSVSIH